MSPIQAVLRGVLIPPARSKPLAVVGASLTLTEAARRIARWGMDLGGKDWDCRFTRMDKLGWQILLPDPALSLRAMLLLQARLLAAPDRFGSRIAIGLGRVDYVGPKTLSSASGPAFDAAALGMKHLGKLSRVVVAGLDQPALPQAVLDLADQIARGWSMEQAEAMSMALSPDNPTLDTLSKRLGISKQAGSYRLTGAGLRPIRAALAGWERSIAGVSTAPSPGLRVHLPRTSASQLGIAPQSV